MIALSLSPKCSQQWQTVSFASTLYLQPVLDRLLANVPASFKADLRLGLQEALVNAAKHGNCLDPRKMVMVQFTQNHDECWWVIIDQGCGFSPLPQCCDSSVEQFFPETQETCGRGLHLLYHIFDDVYWNGAGNELRLHKDFTHSEALLSAVI
ncbi:MAG: ATP-binding protein [Thermosynechococcaceae cyanobacterium]